MSDEHEADRARIDVWMALADQFLDTETRTWIPRAALRCVEAGLSRGEAGRVWRYEVAPAVWTNCWDVVGVWAGWDERWLVDRIVEERGRWPSCPGLLPFLIYRLRVHALHGAWVAIDRCMALLEAERPAACSALASDLELLACWYFDFGGSLDGIDPERAARLEELYRSIFPNVFAPLVMWNPISGESRGRCARRIEEALERLRGAPGPEPYRGSSPHAFRDPSGAPR